LKEAFDSSLFLSIAECILISEFLLQLLKYAEKSDVFPLISIKGLGHSDTGLPRIESCFTIHKKFSLEILSINSFAFGVLQFYYNLIMSFKKLGSFIYY